MMGCKSVMLLTSAAAFCACGGEMYIPEPVPVDGLYRYAMERTKNTCSDELRLEQGTSGYLDVFARLDGRFDLHHGNIFLPLPFDIEGFALLGSDVDISDTWGEGGGTEYAYSLKGAIAPDRLDLTVRFKGVNDCRQVLHLTGGPFPVADPTDVEGYYAMTVEPLGNSCDGLGAEDPQNVVSTFWETSGGDISASFFDYVTVTLGPRGERAVDWEGTVSLPMGFFSLELAATLSGTYGPDAVDLEYNEWDFNESPQSTECRRQYRLTGSKRLPSLDALDNDYRMHYTVANACADEPSKRAWDLNAAARVITQPDGGLALQDHFGSVVLRVSADGAYAATLGSLAEGATLEYSLHAAPPDLTYTLSYNEYDESGAVRCAAQVQAKGLPRYIVE